MDTAREDNGLGENSVVDVVTNQSADAVDSSTLEAGTEPTPTATAVEKEQDQTEQQLKKKKKRADCKKKHGKKNKDKAPDDKEPSKKPKDSTTTGEEKASSDDDPSSDSSGSDSSSDEKRKQNKKKALKKKAKLKSKLKALKKKAKKYESDSSDSDSSSSSDSSDSDSEDDKRKKKKAKAKAKKRKSKKYDSESEESDSDSETSDSETDSEEEERKRKKKSKKAKAKAKAKAKKKSKKYDSDSDSDSDSESSESDSDSEEEERSRRKRRHNRKSKKAEESSSSEDEAVEETPGPNAAADELQAKIAQLQLARLQAAQPPAPAKTKRKTKAKKPKKPAKRASTLEYKRVDQLWDSTIHNYKLTESAEDQVDEFDEYVFCVRRKFDWENKYRHTVVDIKSKLLRDALQEIMKDVKGVSLVEEQPSVDPNMLFLYLNELKTHYRKTLRTKLKKEKKKKLKRRLKHQISHCKLMAAYIDEDYEETKKTLYPMLKAGNITFDLLWALFKPNCVAYTPTYGSTDDPRCFKVDYANKESSFMRGEWYCIEGRYLEYDGKKFGLGDFAADLESFKGARKITSLAAYPIEYHKDPEGLRKELIERGKKFVGLQGMNYRAHKGLAFMKKKKAIAKVNINGRVMIDPAIFRRINPNYPIAMFKPKEEEDPFNQIEDSDDECSGCCGGSDSEDDGGLLPGAEGPLTLNDSSEGKTKFKWVMDKDKNAHYVEVPVDEQGNEILQEKLLDIDTGDGTTHRFTEEELLIASPVVLGFAFSEKLWLEFPLSGVRDIEWNDQAFDSLVLPSEHKWMVKGMVSSHKNHGTQTIDDVIQGKGRGIVFLLHGPPGVGKTLTAEGIAEYLRCPLYCVSSGELGTDPARLELELNRIMDITHSWNAVLLLDEADVFMERREPHDIHRNALVSIFLRELEYFQGILFLTTNRVETFDDAFQSRICMGLKYGALVAKQRKEIWRNFVNKVKACEERAGLDMSGWDVGEEELVELSKKELNGRLIKNAVRTAQSVALSEEKRFSMRHIRGVLTVMEDFDSDVRGYGFKDAMNHYT
jgi:hypothetical protein